MNRLQFLTGYLGQFGFMAWVLLIGALSGAIWKFRGAFGRTVAVTVVLGLFAAFPGRWAWEVQLRVERYKTAEVMFQERCKKSGEFIRRTVPNVDGFTLLKLRPEDYSPYMQDAVDPYGYDFDWGYKDKPPPYIGTFLIGKDDKGNYQEIMPTTESGYRFVEAVDSSDGKRYRYTGSVKVVGRKDPNTPNHQIELKRNPNFDLNNYDYVVDKNPVVGSPTRYGLTYDDISTPEERAYWIAASSLKVIDLQTNEVIAERIGYMVDYAQGATPGGRQPWTYARKNEGWSCPELKNQSYGARRFVEKVLKIRNSQPINRPDAVQ